MSEQAEKVEIIPAAVPLWAVDLQVRIAKLEVKMNLIGALAAISTSAVIADFIRVLMLH